MVLGEMIQPALFSDVYFSVKNVAEGLKFLDIFSLIYLAQGKDKQTGLINWVLQKSSFSNGQLAEVHICDWLTNVKRIYEPSCLLFYGSRLGQKVQKSLGPQNFSLDTLLETTPSLLLG